MKWRRVFPILVLPAAVCAAGLRAETLTVTAVRDNTLYEDSQGALSNGSGPAIFAGVNGLGQIQRGLLAFDLRQIPAGSVVHAVTLTLQQSNTNDNRPEPGEIQLKRVLRDWGEGASRAGTDEGSGGAGALAAAGDATWVHTFFPTRRWQSAGGDFEAAASASLTVAGNGPYTVQSTSGLIGDVQGWVDRPESNFGWVLTGDESSPRTAKRFDSRENNLPGRRPRLTVEFTPAPDPGTLAFSLAALTVDERSGAVAVPVIRSGGDAGQVGVSYATRDGSASQGEDYLPASGRLVFEAGQNMGSIMVTVLDDDVFEGGETLFVDLSEPEGGASLGTRTSFALTVADDEDLTEALHFAQFGDGLGFTSQIILVNPDPAASAGGRVVLLRSDGGPFPAVLDDENLPEGVKEFRVEAGGLRSLLTGGQGPAEAGSADVLSDRPLAGVILFGGDFGLAGVPAGELLANGFLGPVQSNAEAGVDTGVAVRNLEAAAITLTLELVDGDGLALATASLDLPAMGHDARFVSQFDWTPVVDLSDFQGTIRVSCTGRVTATMIQTRTAPNQFATLPVVAR